MKDRDPASLRGEFYSLPDDAKVDRATAAAAAYLMPQTMESLAIRGGGPPYTKFGRRALYMKKDIVTWLDQGQRVHNTAQLQPRTA